MTDTHNPMLDSLDAENTARYLFLNSIGRERAQDFMDHGTCLFRGTKGNIYSLSIMDLHTWGLASHVGQVCGLETKTHMFRIYSWIAYCVRPRLPNMYHQTHIKRVVWWDYFYTIKRIIENVDEEILLKKANLIGFFSRLDMPKFIDTASLYHLPK